MQERGERLLFLDLFAESRMAAAATILAEIVEGGLDRGLVTAVHRHEEGVGLAGRGFLGVEKLVPVGPDRGFSDIFAGRARTVGPGGEQLRNFLSRLGEIDGTCLGLRQIPLALEISLDGPSVLALLLHCRLAILENGFLVLRKRHPAPTGHNNRQRRSQ